MCIVIPSCAIILKTNGVQYTITTKGILDNNYRDGAGLLLHIPKATQTQKAEINREDCTI